MMHFLGGHEVATFQRRSVMEQSTFSISRNLFSRTHADNAYHVLESVTFFKSISAELEAHFQASTEK